MNYPCAFSLWGREERDGQTRVRRSDKYTMGPECAAFEREFAAHHARKHGIMVNSGSSANLIAAAALFHVKHDPLVAGEKAVVPALAWSTTYAPLVQYGLDLVLADCDETWNAVPLPRFRMQDARLLVTASILGNPGWLREWRTEAEGMSVAAGRRVWTLEDNCESAGASTGPLKGRRLCGTYADLSTFSFFHSHQLSAIEGGMILTDDDELNILCRMLRAHGWTRDLAPPPGGETQSFEKEYDFRVMGYNVRPLEMHAAIARAQLPKLEDFRRQRQQNWNNFVTLAQGAGLPLALPTMRGFPNPFGLHFRVKDGLTRRKLAAALREAGIDCRLPTGGSFRRHAYGAQWADQETPCADLIHDTGLFLGNGPIPLDAEIARAVGVMKEVL